MTPGDRRSAQRRVGAATIAAFLILLLLGAARGPAQAESTVPAPATAPSPTVEPNRTQPAAPDGRGFPHDHDGDGGGFHRGGGGGGSATVVAVVAAAAPRPRARAGAKHDRVPRRCRASGPDRRHRAVRPRRGRARDAARAPRANVPRGARHLVSDRPCRESLRGGSPPAVSTPARSTGGALGLAAALLVWSAEAADHATASRASVPASAGAPPPTDPPATGSPVPVPTGRLWSGPLDDDPPRRGGTTSTTMGSKAEGLPASGR